MDVVLEAGFRKVCLRGDTAFALTEDFDHWCKRDVEFVFGMAAHPSLVNLAESLPGQSWRPLERKKRAGAGSRRKKSGTRRGQRKPRVKRRVITERGYKHLELAMEEFAEFSYQPTKCKQSFRMIVLRKTINVHDGQRLLVPEIRFHFYITNVSSSILSARAVIRESNDRCNQENLIEQTKNGIHAMRMPCDTLEAHDTYMVVACLAWNLKPWAAQLWPDKGAGKRLRKMEFRRFVACVIDIPCQIVETARGIVHRFLACPAWITQILNAHQHFKRPRFE